MRKLLLMTTIMMLTGSAPGLARGGGSHGHSMGHRSGAALLAPASPSVPPSLTPDPRLTGSAPLPPHHRLARAGVPAILMKPDPEDVRVNRLIKNICRGC